MLTSAAGASSSSTQPQQLAPQVAALVAAYEEEVLPAHAAAAEATQLETAMRAALQGFTGKSTNSTGDGDGHAPSSGGHVDAVEHGVLTMSLAEAALWRGVGLEVLDMLCERWGPLQRVLIDAGAVEELFTSNLRGKGGAAAQRLLVRLV